MQSRVQEIRREFDRDLAGARDPDTLERVRARYLGRRAGLLTDLMRDLREVPAAGRAAFGKAVNDLKAHVEGALEAAHARLVPGGAPEPPIHLTPPGRAQRPGPSPPSTPMSAPI